MERENAPAAVEFSGFGKICKESGATSVAIERSGSALIIKNVSQKGWDTVVIARALNALPVLKDLHFSMSTCVLVLLVLAAG